MTTYATTEFPLISSVGFNGSDWFVPFSVNGEVIELNVDLGTSSSESLIKTFNLTGTVSYWIPLAGTIWADTGWALEGDAGDDTLQGWTLTDWLKGSAGNDKLYGMEDRDSLEGGAGRDTLYGGDDEDTLVGGTEDDSLYGGADADQLWGSEGNDWLNGDQGADTLRGGLGNDGYNISASDSDMDSIVEAAGEGTDTVYTNRTAYTLGTNIENLFINAALTSATTLNGNVLANEIRGGAGADNVWGWSGADILRGNNGNDILRGGYDNDTLFGGAGSDRLLGETGADYLDSGSGTDTMEGGAGNDYYVVEDTTDIVVEALDAGSDRVESLLATYTLGANVENLRLSFAGYSEGNGNALNNTIQGSIYANLIDGNGGNDYIYASFGNDTAYGDLGNDYLAGEIGDDKLYGDDGFDTLEGGAGLDFLYGGTGNDSIRAGDGTDFAYGGLGDDTIRGDAGGTTANADYLYGDAGNDQVFGDGGNDVLRGGDGNDQLRGGDGNDQIYGDAGTDLLYGEAGADKFIFRALSDGPTTGYDRIMDFVSGTDKIDLSNIDAIAGNVGNDAFHFNATKPFFASAGDLNVSGNLMGTLVEGDVNGDGITDFRVLLVGTYSVVAADFIL